MHDAPLVSVQLVVWNGQRYVKQCLDAVMQQTYSNIELLVLDNASTDATRELIGRYATARLVSSEKNLGMWPGQELLLNHSRGVYVLALSVDVILDPDFISNAVAACQRDPTIGAVQGKLYQFEVGKPLNHDRIDTCGFAMSRARKVINIGHGKPDGSLFTEDCDVFGVEGAAPFFRRTALEACRVGGHITDPDYFWYGDDFDLAWRMTLFGHRSRFVASAFAWHDRSTTKSAAEVPVVGQLGRLSARRAIPLAKRRLDWANVRFTLIKNEYTMNVLRDIVFILAREIAVFGYTLLFEPAVFVAYARFVRLLPRMLERRAEVMRRAVTPPNAMRAMLT